MQLLELRWFTGLECQRLIEGLRFEASYVQCALFYFLQPATCCPVCFSGKDYSNLKYDALEGNAHNFFCNAKQDVHSAAVGLPVPSIFTNAPCGPSFHIVKSTCSVDIYQLVLRNLHPSLSTSALRKLPPFLPAAR